MLGNVFICGEVSNVTYHSKGHIYFTLKDEKAVLSCVMYASNTGSLRFRLSEGMSVVVNGYISVYEGIGRYQLCAKSISFDGQGALSEEFERLKNKLDEMGMFAPEYKRPLPFYVHKIGVVTAPTGAAIRDIINITKRRNPYVQIILYPAIVQGSEAPESIIAGIEALSKTDIDVMIVGRGGGSMEDLWGFNDEKVAEAIFNCPIPVVSAVGHEIDFTIADFVADLRAPTPSAAAEIVVRELDRVQQSIYEYKRKMEKLMDLRVAEAKNRLDALRSRTMLCSPKQKIDRQKLRLSACEDKIKILINNRINDKKYALSVYAEQLKGLSPLDKLSQGYSRLSDENGNTIYDVDKIKVKDTVRIYLKNGMLKAEITEVNKIDAGRKI